MAINSITFNGQNSLDYGLYVSGDQTFNSAEKDYSKVSVPGRNGDLLVFNNRYKNVNVPYNAILIDNYEENAERVRAWLLSANGYCRLEDTYHPNEFRIASFSGPIDFDTKLLEAGETTLTFDCKPQRWLKSGEQKILITSDDRKIVNSTLFDAKPLIRVYGTGTVQIGTGSITVNVDIYESTKTYKIGDCVTHYNIMYRCITNVTTAEAFDSNKWELINPDSFWVDVDCDIMDCYQESINRNKDVSISKWPTLTPGNNNVIFPPNSNISQIVITPRWWTL